MADKKLSQLTDASTPLTGSESAYVVQGGAQRKTTVNDLMQAQFAANLVTEATTSRTLSSSDMQKIIVCTSSSAVTISCPDGLGGGFNATIIQAGTGKVTLAASGTATLNSYSGLLSTMGQYAVVSVVNTGSDAFVAAGNLGV